MNPLATTNPYKRHRFPPEIIAHGVWLYFRFCLSYRDVEVRRERRAMAGAKGIRLSLHPSYQVAGEPLGRSSAGRSAGVSRLPRKGVVRGREVPTTPGVAES
jgi:hypothetical protein